MNIPHRVVWQNHFRRDVTSEANIIQRIAESAEEHLAPDGKQYRVITQKAVTSIADAENVSLLEVQVEALKQGIVPWRYLRNIGTIGLDGQIRLLQSAVAVVGVGGLGGITIELLARQGVGHIFIIDNDRYVEQNLNRQIMCTEGNLGEHKALVAARRVNQINSAIKVTALVEKLTQENAIQLLKDATIVVDGLDNLPSRIIVEEACRKLGIPFVYGTIAGFSGQLMTIYPEDKGLTAIFGPSGSYPDQGIETKIGTPSATPVMVAAWQVQEVIKIITGIGRPLRNHILLLDAIEGVIDKIELGGGE